MQSSFYLRNLWHVPSVLSTKLTRDCSDTKALSLLSNGSIVNATSPREHHYIRNTERAVLSLSLPSTQKVLCKVRPDAISMELISKNKKLTHLFKSSLPAIASLSTGNSRDFFQLQWYYSEPTESAVKQHFCLLLPIKKNPKQQKGATHRVTIEKG